MYRVTHHSMHDFSKDNMFSIQPLGVSECDEKLRAVGVPTRISHGHPAWTIELQFKVLIWKLLSVDASTCETKHNLNGINDYLS